MFFKIFAGDPVDFVAIYCKIIKHFIFNNLGLLCLLANLFMFVVIHFTESLYFSFSLHFTVLSSLFLTVYCSFFSFVGVQERFSHFGGCMSGLSLFVPVAPSPPMLWIISVLMREVVLTLVLAWLAL